MPHLDLDAPSTRRRIQTSLLLLWVLLIPLSFFLRESLIWIVFMSHYAIIAAHWSAVEGTKPTE